MTSAAARTIGVGQGANPEKEPVGERGASPRKAVRVKQLGGGRHQYKGITNSIPEDRSDGKGRENS